MDNTTTEVTPSIEYDLYNYACSDKGLLLPLINEYTWPIEVRAALYFIGLIYCFLGVAIIADVFMCAIEKITSQTRKIVVSSSNDDEPEVVEVKVWNDTVANLTLMALGSSAPEILLSIIEVVGKGFHVGELGPGTIVGSAAFNLLIICAVCIVAIVPGESRRINAIKVFGTTAFFSVFAYIWLLIILIWNTKDYVDLWEAVLTFLLFPICVILAYVADRDFCSPKRHEKARQLELGFTSTDKQLVKNGKINKTALISFMKEVRAYEGLSDEDAAVLAASKLVDEQPHSRLWYRIGAVRDYTGGRKTRPNMTAKLQEVYDTMKQHGEHLKLDNAVVSRPITASFIQRNAIIEFHAATCAVVENIGKFPVTIKRHGHMGNMATVRIESFDGTAMEGEDYTKVDQTITFNPNEEEKEVMVEIINDNQWEPDEVFFLKMTLAEGNGDKVALGKVTIMEITILNDDEPGTIQFKKRGWLVTESIGNVAISVVRLNGADGEVSVKWRTIDKSAINGKDFIGGSGVLTFKHTEVEIHLEIPIVNDLTIEKDEHFEIELYEASGGAQIGTINKTMVTITNDDDFDSVMDRVTMMTNANVDAIKVYSETWASQFKDAMNVNGGNVDGATTSDYVMHFLTFGWKIIFAFVPPPGLLGGWICFCASLVMIGILTAIIGDLASIFGCLVEIPDGITAITLVAAGTSLPDLFASRTAAKSEKYADNAIGNVTGSNSVNVFLGLGLPWLMAAIYWFSQGLRFEVPAGSLGFSVAVYTVIACISIALLMARRWLGIFGKGELGGPPIPRYVSAIVLVLLWGLYIILSSLQTLGHIKA